MEAIDIKEEIIAKIGKIAFGKAMELIRYKNYDSSTGEHEVGTCKLSNFYNSRTTNYANCLNNVPFIIYRDTKHVTDAGYSKNCKAVITLDTELPLVQRLVFYANLKELQQRAIKTQQRERSIKAIDFTNQHFAEIKDEIIAELKSKYSDLKFSHKEANSAAWHIGCKFFNQDHKTMIFDQVTLRNLIEDLRA
jgi:hypothetical protein